MLRTELIRPVSELLVANAWRLGDKVAFSDDYRSVSYTDLELRTRWLAGQLSALSLEPGDRAAIYLGNRVETIESYLAITRSSAIGTPFNPHSTDAELAHLLDDSGARVVITDAGRAEQVRRVLGDDREAWIIVVGDAATVTTGLKQRVLPFEVLAGTDPGVPARDDLGLDEPAWMLYTSGTTGKPKGVLSTQRSCLWSVAACYAPVPGLSEDDHVVWPLPLFHSLAHIFCVLAVTSVGASARIVGDASAEAVVDVLANGSYTFLAGVPTMYHTLIRAVRHGGYDLPPLRMCLVGGAVTTASLRRDVEETLGAPLLDAYGSTETCGSIAINWPTGARVEGSCGLPVPGLSVRLVDPQSGQDVDVDHEGEVWVRGPNVMLGYHNQPDATSAALRDGWYRTGDLAVRDGSGYLTVTGRIKELIIRGGENIHPVEVEQVLREVPGVADAAVVGRPHEVLGEVPIAFVVPDARGVEPDKLFAACREKLSYFKIPEELYEIDRIPRTTSGKITRHKIAERPALLRAAGNGEYESLFRLDWVPLTHPATPPAVPARWAVVGTAGVNPVALPDGDAAAVELRAYAGFAELGEAIADGDQVPEVIVCRVPAPVADPAAGVVGFAQRLGDEVRGWLADEHLSASRLVVVTRDAVSTGSGEVPDLAQAAVWGAMRSLPAMADDRLALVDVDSADVSLATLLTVVSRGESQLAIRGGIALAPKLARVAAATDGTRCEDSDPYRSVMITGADAPAAAAVARHLVTVHGTREVLLISTRGQADPAAADLRDELAALDATVDLAGCDVADRAAFAAVLAEHGQGLSAALYVPGRAEVTGDELRRVVSGAVNLHELTTDSALASFVLFSSVTGTLGAAGEPARAAAAAALDALATRRHAAGQPALALAWGPPWGSAQQAIAGIGALSDRETSAMFDAAHTVHDPFLVSFKLDPGVPGNVVPAPVNQLVDTRLVTPDRARATELRARLGGLSDKERRRELLEIVVREVATLRAGGTADADRPFREIGLTSLTAVQLCQRLVAATGLALPTTLAFDHPTPRAVAEFLRAGFFERAEPDIPKKPRRKVDDEPIAIVAMGCRLPGGVSSPADLWRLVESSGDAMSEFPTDRGWPLSELLGSGENPGRSSTRHGGFLDDVAGFDAPLFAVSPREAQAMDPQQRLLLEVSWEAFERAGIDPMSLRGEKVGAFVGLMHHDYASGDRGQYAGLEGHLGTGKAGSVASGRIAYTFGFEGPAVTVDTACSSSLVSLHLAAQSLRGGECDLALAGGVAVMATPETFVEFSQQGALSVDGRCKAFADAADGTGWSEGVSLVLLERLSDARANGHPVLALVRGSAVNQDGASNGLTAPSGPSQERVIRQALEGAGLSSSDVDAVEAHGTGTALGDPIEANALLATYGRDRDAERPLLLGSVKSNIGHTQAAAGVTGVIKMVQAMRHGVLPQTLHVDRPSSHVDWTAGGVELLTEAMAWPEIERPRRAGVSSFGVSGTNAHVIVEQAPAPAGNPEPADGGGVLPLVLSGQSEAALRTQAERVGEFFRRRPDADVVGARRAMALSRAALSHRAVVLADPPVAGLTAMARDEPDPGVTTGVADVSGRLVFVFPGQGTQWVGMGAELLESSPVFAAAVAEVAEALSPYVDWSLTDALRDAELLDRVDVVQPASFAVMVALAELWRSCGIVPDAVVGHSQGEIAAAVVSGALSLADGARVVALRSQLIATDLAGHGGMMSVAVPASTVVDELAAFDGRIELAAVNGPESTVVAGKPAALDELFASCTDRGVRARRIAVDYASHTSHVERIETQLLDALREIAPRDIETPMFSSVHGRWLAGAELGGEYWYRNLRQRVEFADAVTRLIGEGYRAAVEVSAHPVLTGAVQDLFDDNCDENAVVVGTLRRDDGASSRFYRSVAELWVRGITVDWAAVFDGIQPTVEPSELPTYAFQHQRYWLESAPHSAADVTTAGLVATGHPMLGAAVSIPDTGLDVFTGRVSVREHPWLADHRVGDVLLMPGTAWLDLLFYVGERVGLPVVEELTILSPTTVPEDGAVDVHVVAEPPEDGRRQLRVHTRHAPDDAWTESARAVLVAETVEISELSATSAEPVQWPPAAARELDLDGFYDRLNVDYGPAFHAVTSVWLADDATYAEVRLPDTSDDDGYGAHPVLLDALLQPLDVSGLVGEPGKPRLAFSWSGCRLAATDARWLRVRLTAAGGHSVSLTAVDQDGLPVVSVDRLVVRPVEAEGLRQRSTVAPNSLFEITWSPATTSAATPDWAHYDDVRGAEEFPPVVVTTPEAVGDDATVPQRVRATGFRVLRELQEWLADARTGSSRLVVAIPSNDLILDAVKGLLRTAESEHPGRFGLLELDDQAFGSIAAGLAPAADEPHVAVKDGAALVPRLTPVVPPRERVSLAGETVLVTGATGGLGRLVTEHLAAEHGVAELILVSRQGAEPEWLDHLAVNGVTVRSVAADVSDRAALAGIVDDVSDRLAGVVHVAGVVDDGVLTGLDADSWNAVLRTKVDAAWHLHELTEHLALKAFVLYSSASATFGSAGQGNYTTANAFLDTLAHYRAARGLPAVSLAWGLWDANVGMGSRIGAADLARMTRQGTKALSARQGLALFDAVLAADRPALVPIRLDPSALRADDDIPSVLRALVPAGTRRRAARDTRPAVESGLADIPQVERRERLLALVRGAAAAVLGHDTATLDVTSSFKELGVDSLLAVELRNRLTKATGVRLPATLVFDHPTPNAVATHLAAQFGDPEEQHAVARPTSRGEADEAVAIVAMGCRLPGGVSSPEDLWRLVDAGGDVISEFPDDRGWDLAELYDPDADVAGKTYVRAGGFLRDVGDFDPTLFRITPREALSMDPQQRHLLEITWETLERAGIDPTALAGSATGVFVGTHGQDYGTWAQAGNAEEGHLIIGKAASVLSGRIAYTFGFEGPAVTVDTACSSSLVSMHLAAQSLRSGECDLALAGGASIMSTLHGVIGFSRQRGLAADGRCKAFADAADGFGMAEGAAVLLLERLSDARANGHRVLALVRGSAVNQDGASNGLTAPSGPSQERVIRQALTSAGLAAADVDCVEGHGTGTALGDPIEANALLATYGQDRDAERPLWLGSVKSNVGHTQAAAGVTGVIKMVQAMRHGVLPRTLHVDKPSSHVDWSAGGVEVLAEDQPWPDVERPRRAGVSSFGVSGTNAHVILEQPAGTPEVPDTGDADDRVRPLVLPLVLSGQSEAALRAQAIRLGEALSRDPEPTIPGVGRALALSRAALPYRAVVVAEEPRAELVAIVDDVPAPGVVTGLADVSGRLAFVFPGQGTQWAGMGAELLESSPVFAGVIAECEAVLAPYVDWSLTEVLRDGAHLDRVDVVQPASFAVMVALAEVWRSCGVEPDAVVGHSQGELAAAVVAGALSLAAGARVVAQRSKLIAKNLAGRGGMMSVSLPASDVRADVAAFPRVEVAVVNGPLSTVVAGDAGALDELVRFYDEREVRARRIAVDYASHTSHVELIEDELLDVLQDLSPEAPGLPMFSSVLGRWVEGAELDGEYWYRNLRQAVEFADAVRRLLEQGYRAVVEVSAHPVLNGALHDLIDEHCEDNAVVVGTLRRDEGGLARFYQELAGLWVRGVAVEWEAVFDGVQPIIEPADLPTYAFQRQRYWLSAPPPKADVTGAGLATPVHPMLDAELAMASGATRVYTGRISMREHPWLADHRVGGVLLLPGTVWLDLLFHIGDRIGLPTVEELTVLAPTVIPEDGGTEVQVVVEAADDDHSQVRIHSRDGTEDAWVEAANATMTASSSPSSAEADAVQWPPAGARAVELDGFYESLPADYGPAFRAVRSVWQDSTAAYAEVRLPETGDDDGYGAHPVLLDALLHPLDRCGLLGESGEARLAFSWSGCRLDATGARSLRVRLTAAGADAVSLTAVDDDGMPVVSIDRLVVRPVDSEQLRRPTSVADLLFDVSLVPAPASEPIPDWAFYEEPIGATVPPIVVYTPDVGSDDLPLPERVRAAGFRVLQDLQAWVGDPRAAESRLMVVTRSGDLTTEPLRGLVRTAESEHPGRFGLLDVDRPGRDTVEAALASAAGEPEVAVRDGNPFAVRLTRATVPDERVSLAGETVLVTGATGGLGRLVTEHLVLEHGVAELILVSRSGADREWLTEVAATGVTVRSVAADVSDRDALAEIVDDVADRLTVVIHTAGVVNDGVLTGLGEDAWNGVLKAKVDAAWHLHELTEHLALKAFVLYSAAAATFGNPGQGNYTTANAFLDGLARHRAERGLPAHSLAWGLWDEQVGMGSRLGAADKARMARQGTRGFSAEQGLALFDAALASDAPFLVPVRLDLRALRDSGEVPPLLRALVPADTRRTVARRDDGGDTAQDTGFSALPADERGATLLALVRATTAAVVGHQTGEDIPAGSAFQDLGIDSLLAVELRNRLNKVTGTRLPATVVFDHPTPQVLAAHLTGLFGDETVREEPVQAKPTAQGNDADDPIAIVAMGCRLPGGVDSPADLWRLLESGEDAISDFPADRGWRLDPVFGADNGLARTGGFLDGAAAFDPDLFQLTRREAETMDPQQRQLLEVAWETIEDAGLDPMSVRGRKIGVFAGLVHNGYADNVELEGHLGVGTVSSVATGRVAYTFGLEGPAVTVDTACSSSLVALHLAAQSVRNGDSELALAGGVAVMATPATFANYVRQGALAPDGRCKAFAEGADGMAMSEGVALVLVERLSDARRNGHRVLALLRGSAVNQDGASNGLTSPSGPAQERVIRQALANGRLTPADVDAVEGHGTGTPLGDPIEVNALLATYGQDRDPARPLWLGSVKSNIGHSQAAGGIAGVIKMVQAIRHGHLPRTLHADEPTSGGEWDSGAVELLTEARPWTDVGRPRRAGVSSFGVSGTNAHVVLEEAAELAELAEPPAEPAERTVEPSVVPWVFAGKTPDALRAQADRLATFLAGAPREEPRPDRVDVGFSLALKARLEHRAVIMAGSGEGALEATRALAAGEPHPDLVIGESDSPGLAALLEGFGQAGSGGEADLLAWFTALGARRVELPTYAFQQQRYWLAPADSVSASDDVAPEPESADGFEVTDPESLARRLTGRGDEERKRVLVDLVRVLLADFVDDGSAADVADDDNLFELGGFSSLTSVQFRNRLNEIVGRRLPVTIVFNNPTPALLADSIREWLGDDDASKGGDA